MKNKYVTFIPDDHLLTCIGNLHKAYLKAKTGLQKEIFTLTQIKE
jgi:hypothetical protein